MSRKHQPYALGSNHIPFIAHCYVRRRAKDLMQSNIGILHSTAEVLLEKEQIDGEEFQNIILASQAEQYLKPDAPQVKVPYQNA